MGSERRELPAADHLISAEDRARAMGSLADLLPCPFCGGDPLSIAELNAEAGNVVASVFCSDCICKMVSCYPKSLEDEARSVVKRRWNRRTAGPPAIDPDLLAALRSALAEGCSAEDLMAGVRQARDASVCRRSPGSCTCGMHVTPVPREWGAEPSRPWTFCADSQPVEAGRYELAYVVRGERRRAFALWGAPRDLPPVWSLPGIGGRVAGAYAWRPVVEDLPPLRSADRAYLATQGVPAELLGTPEED